MVGELSSHPPNGVPAQAINATRSALADLVASQKALRTCLQASKADDPCKSLRDAASQRFGPAAEALVTGIGIHGSRNREQITALYRPS